MKNIYEKIFFIAIIIFSVAIFSQSSSSLPPHPLPTTSISTPSQSGNSEKVIEINFSINKTNQITLNSLSIKNLPQAVVSTSQSDFYLTITNSNNQILFNSNILAVFDPQTHISNQYFAIPYPNDARYLYFYYQNQQIARYNVPQEFPWLYLMIGIIAAIILAAVYLISRKYTIGF